MSKKIKIIILMVTVIISIFNVPLYSNAGTLDEIIKNADDFLDIKAEDSKNEIVTPDQDSLKKIFKPVSEILFTIAVAVTFISLAVMGINFAIQNAEDKAKIKESMIPWIVGVIISFGAYGIWKFVMLIFYNF